MYIEIKKEVSKNRREIFNVVISFRSWPQSGKENTNENSHRKYIFGGGKLTKHVSGKLSSKSDGIEMVRN